MSREIEVSVTAEDIAAGERAICERCPVALAVCRVLDLPSGGISVGDTVIALREWGQLHWVADTPGLAAQFIYDFDEDRPVHPFTFTLSIPD